MITTVSAADRFFNHTKGIEDQASWALSRHPLTGTPSSAFLAEGGVPDVVAHRFEDLLDGLYDWRIWLEPIAFVDLCEPDCRFERNQKESPGFLPRESKLGIEVGLAKLDGTVNSQSLGKYL